MADDREIFDSASAPDDDAPPSRLIDERTSTDHAVSDAIDTINRQGPQARAPREAPASQPAPTQRPSQDDGLPEDRSLGGVLQALMSERERRQEWEQRAKRFEQQEQERQRAAEAAKTPLSQRLFEDPDATLAEIRQELRQSFEAEIAKTRITSDFSIAAIRHADVWDEAWNAWYGHVSQGTDPATYFGVMNSGSPGESIIAWYKDRQRHEEIGDDLDAFKERIINEYLAGQGRPPQPRRDDGTFAPAPRAPRLPTATSRLGATNGAGLSGPPEDGSEEAIFAAGRDARR
jgi:hypothetical protein